MRLGERLRSRGRRIASSAAQALGARRKGGAPPEEAAALRGGAAPPSADGAARTDEQRLAGELAARASLPRAGGRDVLDKCARFKTADHARRMGIYPFFRAHDDNDGPEATVEGRRVLMLGSNNYLGLTTHPKVRAAAKAAIDTYGTSMTGSRLMSGTTRLHEELERRIAALLGKEVAIVTTTGYQANLSAISALLGNKKSVAVIDKDDHASIYDGARLAIAAGARMIRYRHGDVGALLAALDGLDGDEGALVVTDGVFSAEGDVADLRAIAAAAHTHRARLMVDDAHGVGVLGPGGRGTAARFGVTDQVDLMSGTFSKSLASIGGWLVGDRAVIDYVRHFAPSFVFSASAAPPCVGAALAALEVMEEEPWRRERVLESAAYMRRELARLGFEVGQGEAAIVPVYVRDDVMTMTMWKRLFEHHAVYTNPFIAPGVAPGQQVLRTSYMATHERAHLDRALEAFEEVGRRFGVI